ncbi:hypothetical protein [Roseateles sp. LYH14W]|uniref:Uncharacterized protein n=1 Tax=Pelomonas parva TaxID=3299032 RepID=A0ABW7F4F2_9BURK
MQMALNPTLEGERRVEMGLRDGGIYGTDFGNTFATFNFRAHLVQHKSAGGGFVPSEVALVSPMGCTEIPQALTIRCNARSQPYRRCFEQLELRQPVFRYQMAVPQLQ